MAGRAANAADQGPQLFGNDVAAQGLVRQGEIAQEMLVEKVAEGAMPDIVQQAGHAQQGLDIAAAGHVGTRFRQTIVKRRGCPTCQVHHAQHVLKAGVFGRGEDPPGGLQLVDLPQPLNPRVVNQLPFRHFAARQAAGSE